ncbi:hypothetical protein QWJ34_06490 [Saccharibacillus sp. CPCC 101409]|uniref:hypothetical protein n=1 Tax=Saccharibacillus sp. CPCC 101409 TaxID=3058041 RepID=UPI002670EF5A|nr:hypothetical protein [Saccharibacillus sp. CPCC 101409]MDO3409405.1 hypothetical protein [Saccharibacillus sp. CPCC 101409]
MRTKRAIYNTLTALLMQLINFGAGLIIPRLIIESYGSNVNGLVVSIVQFIGYLYLIEVGISGALTFSLYKPLAEGDTAAVNRILTAAKNTYRQIGLYASGIVLIMMFVYPLFVIGEQITYFEVAALVAAVGSASLLNYFTIAKYNALLVASQSNYVLSIFRIVYLIANTLIIVGMVHAGAHFALVYTAALGAQLLQAIGIILYAKRKYPDARFDAEPDTSALANRNNVLVHELSRMAVFGSPVILLTLFATLTDVSIYSVYALVFTGINMIIGVFNNGLTAGFGQLFTQKEMRSNLQVSYSQYELLFYMILAFVYSCAWILGLPFVHVYTDGISTTRYEDGIVLLLFVVIGVLENWKIPQSTLIIAAGHFKETRHRAIIEAVIVLIASTILVFPLGLKGVLIGSSLGLAYRAIDLLYAHKLIGISFTPTLLRLIRVFVTGAIIIAPFETVFDLHATGMWSWVVQAIGVALWAGFVILIANLLLERKALAAVLSRVTRVFKR